MKAQNLAKFMSYMLGVDPTEFGLVPDDDNRYKIKDVLKALNEVADYRSVRLGDLKELTLTLEKPVISIEDNHIAATDISRLVPKKVAEKPPKLLYTAIRKKAHAHVLREGIAPVGAPYVLMSDDKATAITIGRRLDQEPLLVEVRTHLCMEAGIVIRAVGQLFIAEYLPLHTFSVPPLKEILAKPKSPKTKPKVEPLKPALNAGSFLLDLKEEVISQQEKQRRTKKDKQLKKERQLARKHKQARNKEYD